MTDNLVKSSYRSRCGIQELHDHTYHIQSFQCETLLSEAEVWNLVTEDSHSQFIPALCWNSSGECTYGRF